jgi:hypothetical protein
MDLSHCCQRNGAEDENYRSCSWHFLTLYMQKNTRSELRVFYQTS